MFIVVEWLHWRYLVLVPPDDWGLVYDSTAATTFDTREQAEAAARRFLRHRWEVLERVR